MNGPVDWGQLIWIASGGLAAFTAGIVLLWRVVSWVSGVVKEGTDARDRLEAQINLRVETSDVRAKLAEEVIARGLAEHRLYAAEHFVTKDGLAEALHNVQASIDRLSDLLNQILVQGAAHPTPLAPRRRGGPAGD